MTKDLAYGQRVINRILGLLSDPDGLEGTYAQLLLEQAQQNAASRPTPQSALAAEGLVVSGNVIRSAGISSELWASAEFGSDIYPQFQHSHTAAGLWLYPAAEDSGVLSNMDDELEKLMDDVIRTTV